MTYRQGYDPRFHAAVEKLRIPAMGTDAVAELLRSIVFLTRPRQVLEVGMGYTTVFLAAALAEVEERAHAESRALAAKTAPYVSADRPLDDEWLDAEPALAAPGFYHRPYRPTFVAVDNMASEGSSATLVKGVLDELSLGDHVTVVDADLHTCADRLPADFRSIDLAWVDAWECLYFFDQLWHLVNPDGGLVAMHYLMTYPEGEAILRYLHEFQRLHPGELEIVSMLEQHKLMQNSVTLLRRTSGVTRRAYARPGGHADYGDELYAEATAHVAAVLGTSAGRPLES